MVLPSGNSTQLQPQAVASVQGAALNTATGQVVTTVEVTDNFGADEVIEITLVNTGSGNGTVVDFDLFPGPGVASPAALPTGMTVNSPFSSVANLRDYFQKVPCQVTGIQLDTDDPANNYNSYLKVADTRPNNTVEERTMRLSNYRISNGGGVYQNVIDINDGKQVFQLNMQKRLRIGKVQAASTLIIRLTIPASHRSFSMQDITY